MNTDHDEPEILIEDDGDENVRITFPNNVQNEDQKRTYILENISALRDLAPESAKTGEIQSYKSTFSYTGPFIYRPIKNVS